MNDRNQSLSKWVRNALRGQANLRNNAPDLLNPVALLRSERRMARSFLSPASREESGMEIPRRYFLKSTGALALYYGVKPLRTLAALGSTKHDSKTEELYKDIVKDYGATGDGVTSDAVAFNNFNAWAIKQTRPIRLNLPPRNYVLDTQNAKRFTKGIKRLVVNGEGASLKNIFVGGKGWPGDNLHSARIATVSAGSKTVTLLSQSDSSRFTVGGWVAVAAFDMMAWGYPQNLWYFEYRKVTAIDPSSGVITLDAKLSNDYLSTYPLHKPGSAHSADMGGPATIFAMDPSWDTEIVFHGVTFSQAQDIYGNGRSVEYIDCKFADHGPAPSVSKHWKAVGTDVGPYVEVDKVVEFLELDNVTCLQRKGILLFQSASIEKCVIKNSRIGKLTGTPKHIVIQHTDINQLRIGATGYGNTLSLLMENCQVNALIGNTVRVPWPPSSIVSGRFTTPNKGSAAKRFVPGGKYFFTAAGGTDNYGTPFVCTAITADETNNYFDTTLPESFSAPVDDKGNYWVSAHPCPNVTVRDCHGCPDIANLSHAPPGRPLFEYARLMLTRDFATVGRVIIWGKLVKLRVNVLRAYTGALASLNLNVLGRFGAGVVGVDGFTLSKWNPVINLQIAGERIITPGTFTGNQTGDSNLSIGAVWFYNGLEPFLSGNISADTEDKWPTVEVEVMTDQGITAIEKSNAKRQL